MDVGTTNGWSMEEVVSAEEIRDLFEDLTVINPKNKSDVAKRYSLPSGDEIGLISSVTEPFCGNCSRARISADGRLFTCLFSNQGLDLLSPIRLGYSDEQIASMISSTWNARDDRYSEMRSKLTSELQKVEMSYIGG